MDNTDEEDDDNDNDNNGYEEEDDYWDFPDTGKVSNKIPYIFGGPY
jgi:hypothetical protein